MDIFSVGTGIVLFLIALALLWKTYRLADLASLRSLWAALGVLIVFFLTGYAVFFVTLVKGNEVTALRPLIAQIFLWGSIFVLLCAWIFLATVRQRLSIEQSLRTANEKLERSQRMEAMGLVAGGIAHDFNNFLTAITGIAEIGMASKSNDPSAREDFQSILEAGSKASVLTRQLLAFSGGQILDRVAIPMADLLETQRGLLQSVVGEDVELKVTSRTGASARIDISQWERVLLNLALNARDAMPNGGSLTFDLDETMVDGEPHLQLTVEDTGHGIPREHAEKIFDPFFTTKQGGENYGLGLASVHGILLQHSGSIRIDPTYTAGARVLITVPVHVADVSADTSPRPSQGQRPGANAGHGDVLIVDDDPMVQALVARMLEAEGYSTVTASSFEDAVTAAEARRGSLRLVITDVVMPGKSGGDLAQWLKSVFPAVPVLFVTGYSTDSEKLAHLHPSSQVCHKPFRRETLIRHVSAILRPEWRVASRGGRSPGEHRSLQMGYSPSSSVGSVG